MSTFRPSQLRDEVLKACDQSPLTDAAISRAAGKGRGYIDDLRSGDVQPPVMVADSILRACGYRLELSAVPADAPPLVELTDRQRGLVAECLRLAAFIHDADDIAYIAKMMRRAAGENVLKGPE